MRVLPTLIAWSLLSVALSGFAGCGSGIHSLPGATTTPTPPGYVFMTGNWQMTVSNQTGHSTFSALAGFIDESSSGSGTSHNTNAVFQLVPGNCFVGETVLPLYGSVDTQAVSFRSFSDYGQFVTISGTKDATATHFTGTFSVGGGCSNGGGGTLTGTKFAPVNGTYTGSLSTTGAAQAVTLHLTQAPEGNGKGYSLLDGTASFSGVSCFAAAAVDQSGSFVSGSSIRITLLATDGESILLNGSFDAAAESISISSGIISGGSCSGSVGSETFTLS